MSLLITFSGVLSQTVLVTTVGLGFAVVSQTYSIVVAAKLDENL